MLQALTKESGASGVTLASLTSPKPVPGEGSVNHMRWYLHGSMDQEVAAEVVKLLKAMIEVRNTTYCMHYIIIDHVFFLLTSGKVKRAMERVC